MQDQEIWQTVDGYSEYEVSNFGNVKKNGKIIQLKMSGGYPCICTNGKTFSVHHLVYTMFSGDTVDTSKFVVHHKDENPYNNRFDNLQKLTKFDHKSLHNSGDKNPLFGKHLSEETKRKLSVTKSGDKNYLYGKHLSEETRRKMSETIDRKKEK